MMRFPSKLTDMMLRFRSNGVFSTHCFRWISQYTTSSATKATASTFMLVDHLVNSLGFSQEEAIATSSKVSRFTSSQNPDFVINFLKESGFDKTQIKNIVYSLPNTLSCNVDKTLKPKLKALQDLGLSSSCLADIICKNRGIWNIALNTHLIPTLECLKTISKSDEFLFKASKKGLVLAKNLRLNVVLLQGYGFSDTQIQNLMLERPRCFKLPPSRVQEILVKVEEKLRIPRNSPTFYRGFAALQHLSEKSLEYKIGIFKGFGFTYLDIWTLAGKMPNNLVYSESKIRSGLKFYMEDLGYDHASILKVPGLLTFSMEKRVIPRYKVLQVLKEKRLIKTDDYPLRAWIYPTESQFMKKFLLPFKDVVPDLCRDYVGRVGCPIDGQGCV